MSADNHDEVYVDYDEDTVHQTEATAPAADGEDGKPKDVKK